MSSSLEQSGHPSEIKRAKRDLRRAIVQQREARSVPERESDDAARFGLLCDVVSSHAPTTVAVYLSVPPEPDTRRLIDWLAAHNIVVLLPVLTTPASDDQLIGPPDWAPHAGNDRLRQGRLSIIEPDTEPVGGSGLKAAQLIICPGLAGNDHGQRLGRGGGWYDRALANADSSAVTLLPLNDDELYEQIPVDHWDRRVDVIVTPARVIDCAKSTAR